MSSVISMTCLAATCSVEIMLSSYCRSKLWSLVHENHHCSVNTNIFVRDTNKLHSRVGETLTYQKLFHLLEQSLCLHQKQNHSVKEYLCTPPTHTWLLGNSLPITPSTRQPLTTHSPDTGFIPADEQDRLSNLLHCCTVYSVPIQAHCFSCFPLCVSVLSVSWLSSYIDLGRTAE